MKIFLRNIMLLLLCFSVAQAGPPDTKSPESSERDDDSVIDRQPLVRNPIEQSPLELTPKEKQAENRPKDDKGEWIIAPVPSYDPSQLWGLALMAQYIFKQDPRSKPSMIGGAVFGSEKKSYGGALGYLGRFDEDNWKVMAGGGYAKINSDFYGVGKDASSKDISVLMEQKVTFFSLQVTPKIWGVFVGLTLGYNKIDNSFDVQGLPATVPVNSKLSNESWVPGLKLQLDHRDNTFYPQHGYLTDLQMQFYNENLGSSANFDKYRVDHNQYIHLWDENVLALRAALQAALGDVPFYYLPMFGMRSDLRGFKAGKYRDKVVWDLQAEYRQRFTDHWGGVIFAGAGDVQPSVQEVTLDDLLWSEGVGLRYGLGAKNPVDFQCDVAYGDDAWSWYFGVGQAF